MVQCDPRQQCLVAERPVAAVDSTTVLVTVVGDVDVDPTVAVEVVGDDAERPPVRARDLRLGGNVVEGPVPAVAVEPVGHGQVPLRPAVVPYSGRRRAVRITAGTVVDVVADVEVEPAVAVEVEKRSRESPAGAARADAVRDVGESTVAVVAEQPVGAEPGEIQIDPTVVVEVARRGAHAVTRDVQAAPEADVGEPERAGAVRVHDEIVPVQAIRQRKRCFPLRLGVVRRRPGDRAGAPAGGRGRDRRRCRNRAARRRARRLSAKSKSPDMPLKWMKSMPAAAV